VDRIAEKYNYTHEQVMLLEDEFVFHLQLKDKKAAEFTSRYEAAMEALTKNK